MDCLCAKFGDFSFSRFGFIVRTNRQNHRITDADDRCTHATTVGVSNGCLIKLFASHALRVGLQPSCALYVYRTQRDLADACSFGKAPLLGKSIADGDTECCTVATRRMWMRFTVIISLEVRR